MHDVCNENENKVDMAESLKRECECLRAYAKESEDVASKVRLEYEAAQKKIEELNGKIKFLEGQIEAYQYCVNCRR